MGNKKQIVTKNYKGQFHGYQEWYANNKLAIRGMAKNGQQLGYVECHGVNCLSLKSTFLIK